MAKASFGEVSWACVAGHEYDANRISLRLVASSPAVVEIDGRRHYAQYEAHYESDDEMAVGYERWSWGLDEHQTAYNHRILLDAEGRAYAYDFSKVAVGENVEPHAVFTCRVPE